MHYLARELDELWRGRRVASFSMCATPLSVILGAGARATVGFDLSRPEIRVHHVRAGKERGHLDGFEIEEVAAPIDDRTIIVRLVKPGKFRGSPSRQAQLVISLLPKARGAVLLGGGGQRLVGIGAAPPEPKPPRPIPSDAELLEAVRAGDAQALMRGRWVGPAVARWLLEDPDLALTRYAEVVALPAARPTRCGDRILPHPLCQGGEALESLIEPEPSEPALSTEGEEEHDPTARAVARMRAELERAKEAPRVRAAAELLMALSPYAPVPPSLTLPDGSSFEVQAKAGEAPHEVADRLFAKARSMDRARANLPAKIAQMEARAAASTGRREPLRKRQASKPGPRLPYKRFTSRGGLEIRVGKSAKDNDDLTFHHSSPDDIWMHARDTAGSHVVLRWTGEGSPPAPDLEEAAVLAAWHSQARGSTVVPVDWTRRKHVRKPRGAAPGSVLVSRAKTVMVRPTAEAVRAIRDRG